MNADKVDLHATPHTNNCQFLEVDDDGGKGEGGELLNDSSDCIPQPSTDLTQFFSSYANLVPVISYFEIPADVIVIL